MLEQISKAVEHLRLGGVIAYPTEHCFGLGCDPKSEHAVERIATMKGRSVSQGVLLVAADEQQVETYASLSSSQQLDEIRSSWPGPFTWTLQPHPTTPSWITGQHSSIAMRVSDHPVCVSLCQEFGGAIVSTSANRHAQPVINNWQEVKQIFANEIDFIIPGEVGGHEHPSRIRNGATGEVIR